MPREPIQVRFPTLRKLREERGLTQTKMARLLSEELGLETPIDRSFYTYMESGKRGIRIEVAVAIANVLGLSVREVFPELYEKAS